MANTRKRKAADPLEDSTKRLRFEYSDLKQGKSSNQFRNILTDNFKAEVQLEDDDDDDVSYQEKNDFSDDEQGIETPVTPFSPGPKKFPSQLKTLECTYEGCDKTFNRPSRLATHLRSHKNEKPFSCQYEGCDKAYVDDKHLKQHIKSCHSQERPYSCQWEGCTKSFLTGTRLRRHQLVHEGQNRFRCTAYPPCNETFRKHQTLERHIRSDHLQLAPFPCTYIDPMTAEPCNAGFDGSGGLKKHMERVHGIMEYFCPECIVPNSVSFDGTPIHLGFTTNASLQAHIKKDHANCPFCDRKCASKRELDKHVESQHSGIPLEQRKTIICTYDGCTSTFTKKSNLNIHIRAVHEGQRFICGTFDVSNTTDLSTWDGEDGCGKILITKANLEDHIRTAHLGLPSLINSRRKKASSTMDEDISDQEATTKTKGRKSKPSALEGLLGITPESDERRTISCIIPGCPNKFIRDYDLQNHIRSKHRPTNQEGQEDADRYSGGDTQLYDVDDLNKGYEANNGETDFLGDQEDFGWELQSHGLEGSQFWVGAGDGIPEDQWTFDEFEMRNLIDGAESSYPSF